MIAMRIFKRIVMEKKENRMKTATIVSDDWKYSRATSPTSTEYIRIMTSNKLSEQNSSVMGFPTPSTLYWQSPLTATTVRAASENMSVTATKKSKNHFTSLITSCTA
mmetsp:Transcript_9262/g.15092  ORF Transcript_9262/g.15092 Transcript_9262/m.15092 type:complete len:107 (-) Transcript_9262:418-738(-)